MVQGYLAHNKKQPPPWDRAVAICLGPYDGPRGAGAVSCERGTPVVLWSGFPILPSYPQYPLPRATPCALSWSQNGGNTPWSAAPVYRAPRVGLMWV